MREKKFDAILFSLCRIYAHVKDIEGDLIFPLNFIFFHYLVFLTIMSLIFLRISFMEFVLLNFFVI